MTKWLALGLWCVVALLPAPALSWGVEGHQIIADIAEANLTPAAKQRVTEILQGARMREVSNYADEIRPFRRETARWHFVNIAPGASNYDEARDCQLIAGQGDCLIKAIDRALADLRTNGETQREALKLLIHFIGDLHQPFHAVTEARGGNDIRVTFNGVASNLHRVWDSEILTHLMRGKEVQPAVADPERVLVLGPQAEKGDIVEWALQSRAIGLRALVPAGAQLENAYIQEWWPVMNDQLVLAGLRLARLSNEPLK